MPKKHGLLTDLQFKVLQLRIQEGLSHSEIADMLGTTRENITIIERRARRNIRLAEETLHAYKSLISLAEIKIEPGTHLVDVPGIVVKAGDKLGIKLKVNFTRIYDEIRFKAGNCIEGTRVIKPFSVMLYRDGNIEVYV
jgi:Tfx family DNA-binding protein